MPECLAQGKLPLQAKEMTNLKPNEQPIRKRRRHLEVLSITCSTVGINIVLACFSGVANVFGFKSADMVLNCAFALLVASVIFGVLAMITSAPKHGHLQTSLLCRLFRDLRSKRNTSIEDNEKSACRTALGPEDNLLTCATASRAIENGPVPSKRSDDLSTVQHRQDGFSTGTSGLHGTLSKLENRSPDSKALLKVNKRPTVLFRQSMISEGPYSRKECSSMILYNMEGSNGRMQLVPRMRESLVTEVINEKSVHPQFMTSEMFPQRIQNGVYPCKVQNIDYEAHNNDFYRFAPSTGDFHKSQIDHVSEVISKINEMNFLS